MPPSNFKLSNKALISQVKELIKKIVYIIFNQNILILSTKTMKTLLLLSSSKFLDNDFVNILGKPLGDFKIAHIISAGKGLDDLSYLVNTREIFRQNNCYFKDIDLAGKNKDELRDILKDFDAVFVNGGNTFYLLKTIRESGFDKVLKELLPKGLVYMGASAGSYVACPTIEAATWRSRHKYDHHGIVDFTAMNLVPFLIFAHYTPEYKELLKEKIPKASHPTKVLADNQAILIKDDKIELLGGKEVRM